ncbi:hypothetical protein Nepgr_024935 [Nepenthes gracilis]|uniref:SANTA domain-containing protein n=1 Tax=Nepenthes gracilis TaxID=150966 RepID=A0AAD3T5G9_NEPGR|nr:hypothetical protein Nepgr_024935 [Nepenthes gracilis]
MTSSSSHFFKTVCLHDWWLIRAESGIVGKKLAVSGLEFAEQGAKRMFSSAPITRRLDLFTLETADGVFVILSGYINKRHTIRNGFSSEVFGHFLLGFPPDWEECAERCFEGGMDAEAVSKSGKDSVMTRIRSTSSTPKKSLKGETPSKAGNGRDAPCEKTQVSQDDRKVQSETEGCIPCSAASGIQHDVTPVGAGIKMGRSDSSNALNFKRSRSGRLLLPTLEFWRNQVPVYDADHGICGIREGSDVVKRPKGSKSKTRVRR